MAIPNPKVSIIVLNWNNWKDTLECLESLYQIVYPDYDVILVDNGSEDGSIEKTREFCEGKIEVKSNFFEYDPSNKPIIMIEYDEEKAEAGGNGAKEIKDLPSNSKLILIKNEKNYGFAKGNNIGVRYAMKAMNPGYVLLLNNDTVVERDFLSELVKVGESNSKIGAIGPNIRLYSDKQRAQIKGYEKFDSVSEVNTLSGACLLIKTEILKKVGLLDETYFIYGEDRDFCERIRECGYVNVYVPKVKVYHKLELSTRDFPGFRTYYLVRNDFLIIRRYKKGMKSLKYIVLESQIIKFVKTIILKGAIEIVPYFIKGIVDGFRLYVKNPPKPSIIKDV